MCPGFRRGTSLQPIRARTSVGCPSTQVSTLSWGPQLLCWLQGGNSLIRPSRVFSAGVGGGVWVYWGKLGHLKTSSQEGAVLEPQLQGTQKGEAGGAGRGSKVRENVLWPLLLALGRHCPHLSPGAWATALNSFTLSKVPTPGKATRRVPSVFLGRSPPWGSPPGAPGESTALVSSPGFKVLLSPCISLEHVTYSLVPDLSSIQWAETVSAVSLALSTALACASCPVTVSDEIMSSYTCCSCKIVIIEDQQ